MKKYIILSILSILLLFTACKDKGNTAEATETEQGHEEEEAGTVATLTAEQMKAINVELGSIEKKQLTASLKANGVLNVPNQNRASATATYGGVVKSILVQPGGIVSKGQKIATISNPTFITMQEEFLSTSAKAELAQLEYDRQKTLREGNASSAKTFQQADAELKMLKARKASLQKQLELIGINAASLTSENLQSVLSVSAPIGGSVSKVLVNIGSYVEVNLPVAEIVDNSQLHLDLYVYEKDLPKLKVGQTIHFTLTNNAGREYDAEIYGISNTFEDGSKAVAVHAAVKGQKAGLIDGMNITALVSLDNAMLDAVPSDAIVNFQGQDYIFIVTDKEEHEHKEEAHTHEAGEAHDHEAEDKPAHGNEGHQHDEGTSFERIPVRKGTTDVGYTEITPLAEVPVDAKVVVKGAFFILAKMTNSGGEHHH
ncbi:MAG: efflux RND transporter periplasmic adaptor subunit [Bacteroidetes bacterium]|nr:efflux RND transporter periplasmic adaptor subunit [Bacteroidota bacterium]